MVVRARPGQRSTQKPQTPPLHLYKKVSACSVCSARTFLSIRAPGSLRYRTAACVLVRDGGTRSRRSRVLTWSMTRANDRATASRPAAGTHSGLSSSVCLVTGDRMIWIDGTSFATTPMSPEALGSMSAISPTPNVAYDFSTASNRRSLPLIHHRRGATMFALRMTPFQYLVSETETCSQLIISAVFASTVARLSCIHLVPGEPT